MNKILCILGLVIFASCVHPDPVLEKHEYDVIDTVEVSRNGFNSVLGYDVVVRIEEDSSLHYGEITSDGRLVRVNFKQIKNYYK